MVYELIHGLTWGFFAKSHFKAISFSFIREYLTPYCACSEPLEKGAYILGAMMPCLILGLLPAVIVVYTGSSVLLALGLLMIMAAGGDLTIILKILLYRTSSRDILYMDHPTQGGGVVFER